MLGLKETMRCTDEELLDQYRRNRNADLLGALYLRHTHKLYGLCLSYLKNAAEAEDAIMEIFEALPAKILKYDIGQFEPWLHVLARNHCLKKLQRLLKARTEDVSEISEDFFMENPPEEDHDTEGKRLEVLSDAIDQLNEGQKACIILFFLERKSYKEIAAMTSYEENEVKSHIQNGKRNLKNLIITLER